MTPLTALWWVFVALLIVVHTLTRVLHRELFAPDPPPCEFEERYVSSITLGPEFDRTAFEEVPNDQRFCGAQVDLVRRASTAPCMNEAQLVRTTGGSVTTLDSRVGPVCAAVIDGYAEVDRFNTERRLRLLLTKRNTRAQDLRVDVYVSRVLVAEALPVSVADTTAKYYVYLFTPRTPQKHEFRVSLKHPGASTWAGATVTRSFSVDLDAEYADCVPQRYVIMGSDTPLSSMPPDSMLDNPRDEATCGKVFAQITRPVDDQTYPCKYNGLVFDAPSDLEQRITRTGAACERHTCEGGEERTIPCRPACGVSTETWTKTPVSTQGATHCLENDLSYTVGSDDPTTKEKLCVSRDTCTPCRSETYYFDGTGRKVDINIDNAPGSLQERIDAVMPHEPLPCGTTTDVVYRVNHGRCVNPYGAVLVHKPLELVHPFKKEC